MPKKLEKSLKYLEQGADIVYHDVFLVTKVDQKLFWKKVRTRKMKTPVFEDMISNGNALPNSSVVVRKKLLTAIEGLSEERNLIAAEDYDAWLRIAKLTNRFKRIPVVLGYYWVGGGNINNPSQTIKTTDAIEARYYSEIPDSGAYWICYARGMAYYRMGNYEMAKRSFDLICFWSTPFLVYVKRCWTLLQITLCLRFRGRVWNR